MTVPFSTAAAFSKSIGVNTHLSYGPPTSYQNVPLVVSQIKALGARRVRDGFHTSVTNQATPNSDMDSVLYAAWKEVGVLADISAVLDPSEKLGPMTAATLNTLMFESGMTVRQFEGQNEPDLGTPVGWPVSTVAFHNQVAAAVAGMAQNFRGIPLLSPSLALPARAPDVKWGNPLPFQILNWHYYPTASMPNFAIAESLAYLKAWGNLPVQVTEFGYNTSQISELAAAKYTLRGLLDLWAAGVQATFLYELQDEGNDPGMTDLNSHWGLVNWDGTEKRSFMAIKNLIALLGREDAALAPLNYALKGPTVSTLLLQQGYGCWLLFLWQEIPSFNPAAKTDIAVQSITATLALPSSMPVEVYIPLRQAEPVQKSPSASVLLCEVNDHPTVVKIG